MASYGSTMFGATILYLMPGYLSIASATYQPPEKATQQRSWTT